MRSHNAILLISCEDRPGLVARVAQFIVAHNGNIVHLAQHVDTDNRMFFMRVEWQLEDFDVLQSNVPAAFGAEVACDLPMDWSIYDSWQKPRTAIFVSKESHCLYDLLARHDAGELPIEIPLIVSNHDLLARVAERFNIPFHVFPINKANKLEQERAEHRLLEEHAVDTVILARYMQILSPQFVDWYPNQVINIHHSFLPAFAGPRPYHAAFRRGVKSIGATAHYVTSDLDEGPIITQDVIRVSHKETIADFSRQGRDLEKIVLARAVWWHAHRRVLVHENRTVVFD